MDSKKTQKVIRGPDFNTEAPMGMKDLIDFYSKEKDTSMGGQTSNLEESIKIINEVLAMRSDPTQPKPTIFLGITSNVISSGLRETVAFLCKHKLIDAVVCTGGGIEEDFMKISYNSHVMEYVVDDKQWRLEGKNRIGNMVVITDAYDGLSDYMDPVFEEIDQEQAKFEADGFTDPDFQYITPSELIRRIGLNLASTGVHPNSYNYWCATNDIPVFCPAITDSAIGDDLYLYMFSKPNFTIDVNRDITKLMDIACGSKGPLCAIVLGGGMVKYHVMNACKVAGGLDYGVFITVGEDWDGSYTGADTGEEVSRRAIKPNAKTVTLKSDFSFIFPLMVASTFVKNVYSNEKKSVQAEEQEKEKTPQ